VNCTDRLVPLSGPTEPGPPHPAALGRTLFAGLILIVAVYVAVRAVMALRALRLIRVLESGPSECRLGVGSGLLPWARKQTRTPLRGVILIGVGFG
jgi:hypothetical protein